MYGIWHTMYNKRSMVYNEWRIIWRLAYIWTGTMNRHTAYKILYRYMAYKIQICVRHKMCICTAWKMFFWKIFGSHLSDLLPHPHPGISWQVSDQPVRQGSSYDCIWATRMSHFFANTVATDPTDPRSLTSVVAANIAQIGLLAVAVNDICVYMVLYIDHCTTAHNMFT
jgi:hypothetical protein